MKPQPIPEAEAIAYARKQIADWRTNGVRGVLGLKERVLVFDKNENRQIFKAFIKMTALNTPEGLEARVKEARRGVEVEDEVVRELIVERRECGETLPKFLDEYNIELLRSVKAVRRKPGPRHYEYHQRDLAIYHLVLDIENRFKLKPTRNSEKKPTRSGAQRPSACSIVSSALKQEGVGMNEQAVVTIWKRFHPPLFRETLAKILEDQFQCQTA
jgi:hypothetical protein